MRWTTAVAATTVIAALACGGDAEVTTPEAPADPAADPAEAPADAADDEAKEDGSDEGSAEDGSAEDGSKEDGSADGSAEADAKPVSFEDASFSCCGNGDQTKFVKEYTDVLGKLANDEGAKGEMYAFDGVATKLKKNGNAIASDVQAMTNKLKDMDNTGMRKDFGDLSKRVIDFAKKNSGGEMKVAVVHCDTNDSYWLQSGEIIKSPYGDDCGAFVPRPE